MHVYVNALLTGGGNTSIVRAGLREREAILTHPKVRALIDFSQPVVCVPKTSSTSCDQAVFVDQATGVSLPSDAVPVEISRFG